MEENPALIEFYYTYSSLLNQNHFLCTFKTFNFSDMSHSMREPKAHNHFPHILHNISYKLPNKHQEYKYYHHTLSQLLFTLSISADTLQNLISTDPKHAKNQHSKLFSPHKSHRKCSENYRYGKILSLEYMTNTKCNKIFQAESPGYWQGAKYITIYKCTSVHYQKLMVFNSLRFCRAENFLSN